MTAAGLAANVTHPRVAHADGPTSNVEAGLNSLWTFLDGVATNGRFGQSLPVLSLTPGAAEGIGLNTLFVQAHTDVLGATYGDAASLTDLVHNIDGASHDLSDATNPRHVSYTAGPVSTVGTVSSFPLTVHATRTVDLGLDLASAAPKFSFSAGHGISTVLTLDAALKINYDSSGPGWFSVTRTDTTPSLTLNAHGTIPTLSAVTAGIGILGVALTPGSAPNQTSFTYDATLATTWSDPNNDSKLAFTESDGAGGSRDGELAPAGAAAGLVGVSLASGSLHSVLNLVAESSPYITLPAASALVRVDQANLTTGTDPVVSLDDPLALDPVNAFLNLTPRDLSQGIGQIASLMGFFERQGGIKLPYMQGSLADAVLANESLAVFLKDYVKPSTNPTQPGHPAFASIQELLKDFVLHAGKPDLAPYTFTVTHGGYVGNKLSFTLGISHAASADQSLDPVPSANQGSGASVVYGDTTLRDIGKAFFTTPEEKLALIGRQVLAGSSIGIIKDITGDTITLDPAPFGASPPASLWKNGGTPAAGTAYSIAAGDPQTGLVQLADVLKDDGGIAQANASVPTATVRPSYTVSLPIVLDLQPPNTTDCDPVTAGNQDCPFSRHNADGSTTIVTSLPLAPDRIMLHTGDAANPLSISGDAPVHTAVTVHAKVGFVGVDLTGSLAMCTDTAPVDCSGAPTDSAVHLLSIATHKVGDTDGDISLTALTDLLRTTPAAVLDASVNGHAYADLSVDVPGAGGFFGSSPASVHITVPHITNLAGATITGPDLSKLSPFNFDPSNPTALFAALMADLQAVEGLVHQVPSGGGLGTNVPLLGTSLSKLIGSSASGGGSTVTYGTGSFTNSEGVTKVVGTLTDTHRTFDGSYLGRRVLIGTHTAVVLDGSGDTLKLDKAWDATANPQPTNGTPYTADDGLQGLLNLETANPDGTMQELLDRLNTALGAGSGVSFTVDTSGATPTLKLTLDWKRSFTTSVPLSLDFNFPTLAGQHLLGANSNGSLDVSASGEAKLVLLIPLSAATVADPLTNLRIDNSDDGTGHKSSFIDAHLSVNSTSLLLGADVGPFNISLGDPAHADNPGTQLHAGIGVKLASSATGAATVEEFVNGLSPTLDNGAAAASCSKAPNNSHDLALCAYFPVYLNGTLVSNDDTTNGFIVRLPSDASSLSDLLTLTGDVDADSSTPRFVAPAALGDALSSLGLNMLSMGDGLAGYITSLQNALQLASFNGKLPIVGKDLQAGSNFLGTLHDGLQGAFTGGTDGSKSQIESFLNDSLKPVFNDNFNGTGFTYQIACKITVVKAGAPVATAKPTTPPSGAVGYRYEVVAYTNPSKDDAPPSDPSNSVQNIAALTAATKSTNSNSITWTKVHGATGYRVLVSKAGASFKLLKDVGDVASYTDDGTDIPAATAYPASSTNPVTTTCPSDATAQDITGVTVTVDIGSGDPTTPGAASNAGVSVPLDLGIPGLSIKATGDSPNMTGKLGWHLHLQFGIDRDAGFFVKTQDTNKPEFQVGASFSLPPSMQAQLAFIDVSMKNHQATPDPLFSGTFSIDLETADPGSNCITGCSVHADRQLTLAQITNGNLSDIVKVALTAQVRIDLDLKADLGTSVLPGIGAEFVLAWDWTSDAPSDVSNLTELGFKNVSINPGAFLNGVLGKIIGEIADIYKPIKPVIDTIMAPLPVLSDLSHMVGGDDVTIASLAETFSTLVDGPDIQPFIDVLNTVNDIVKTLTNITGSCAGDGYCINLGDFEIKKAAAMSTPASPTVAQSLIGTTDYSGSNAPDNEAGDPSALGALDAHSDADLANSAADDDHAAFTFPALDDPKQIFGLLMGQDVELVHFDSGPLTLGFDMSESFGPVYAPPPVMVVISGGASVTMHIVAGFDTLGIREAVESGKVADVLNSLYFVTADANGAPIPVVSFSGYLAAGAAVSLVVIEVGIEGGIQLTINFYWNDPDNDGKFRFDEFLATALKNPICLFNVGGELSLFIKVFVTLGISPFSVSFDFTLVDIKLIDFSITPNCTPRPPRLAGESSDKVLYLFAGKFGNNGERGDPFWNNGNNADETWVVHQLPAVTDPDGSGPKSAQPAKVTVQALGITQEFVDDGITTVAFDGRGYQGKLKLTFAGGGGSTTSATGGFTKKVVAFTGDKEDSVRTGSGAAVIDAGQGDDQVNTLDRQDLSVSTATAPKAYVAGGGGKDTISVGNAADWIAGDGALNAGDASPSTTTFYPDNGESGTVALSHFVDVNAINPPSAPGAVANEDIDTISVGLGGSTVYGDGGADIIGVANDNPIADLASTPAAQRDLYRAASTTIVGGAGSDHIKSGSGSDFIYTGDQVNPGADGYGSGDFIGDSTTAADVNTVETGTGSDHVYGSNAVDYVTTHSTPAQQVTAYGGGMDDILIGGAGTDALYGGPGNDYVVAEPAKVSGTNDTSDVLGAARTVTHLPVAASSTKHLEGGGGTDRIYGGDGASTIYGDHQFAVGHSGDATFANECAQQTDPRSAQPAQHTTTTATDDQNDQRDLILGGAGIDTVNAGGGDDYVYAYGGTDMLCGNAGADHVFAGGDSDTVYGGSEADKLYGEADADHVYGNEGDDEIYGGAGADEIQGNNGADTISGGDDADLIIGGTSKALEPDTGDNLSGDTGKDTIIGDNGDTATQNAGGAVSVFELPGTPASAGGPDWVFGGADADRLYGGLDADHVFGGNELAAMPDNRGDYIEGNNGADLLYGEGGADDIIGGSAAIASGSGDASVGYPDAGDTISGGADDDVIAGDNAQLAQVAPTLGHVLTQGRGLSTERTITLLDLGTGNPTANYGGDTITGDGATDIIMGERGTDTIHGNDSDDYIEGGQDSDTIDGDTGQDDIVGGEFKPSSGSGAATIGQLDAGDTIRGGTEGDVVLGDNGSILRGTGSNSDLTKNRGITERAIQLYDLGDSPASGTSGPDFIHGNQGSDVILAQSGNDRVLADESSDYAEGGPGTDWLEGGDGSDDLVGGSSAIKSGSSASAQGQPDAADYVWGQAGDDVETGDNAIVTRVGPFNDLTFRIGVGGTIEERRAMRLLDLDNGGILTAPSSIRYGGDFLSGQGDTDVLLGQDGSDRISGGSGDDYAEGQGNAVGVGNEDKLWGDASLVFASGVPSQATWPGAPSTGYDSDGGTDGQDDLIGGKSQQGFRDANDEVHGNGNSDYILGDNGTSVRDIQSGTTTLHPGDTVPASGLTDRIYTLRYPASLPFGAAKVRHHDPAQSAPTTRYCTTAQATCEVAGAAGNDSLYGEAGDDFIYGQDGNDTAYGGSQDDDIFGELGNDTLFGEAGDDSILGDRGGVRDIFQTGSNHFYMSVTQVPKVEFDAFNSGDVIRVADLLHDVDGDAFVGSGSTSPMPHPGLTEGGVDRIRGGINHDSIHAGFGDDLANGDSGGDWVFGDDGADVLWGGKGCDASVDTPAGSPWCYPNGTFDPAPHRANGETLPQVTDYVVGGKGGTSAESIAGSTGSDVLDWRVRGSYAPGTGCTTSAWPVDLNTGGKKGVSTTVDPCSWFEMSDINDADDTNNQHHQGVDWQYGGWDRDILQGDQADNGPNEGDRLLDWNGAYNLYTHCNSAYGGFNDVRQHSPDWQSFLQRWVYAQGAGQNQSDAMTAGTSAFVELALVYPGVDNDHGSGSAYPSTPGHFDNPNSCAV
ncbi:MAG: hypothetical protein QOJ92_1100 [Frankiales bacterium]|nr:hypothetical protein [Frankiales bacterium]